MGRRSSRHRLFAKDDTRYQLYRTTEPCVYCVMYYIRFLSFSPTKWSIYCTYVRTSSKKK